MCSRDCKARERRTMGKKGRVINCRSHLNTIRILTQLKNEGGEKKMGEGRERKKRWNNWERERERWDNEEEGRVLEEISRINHREFSFPSPCKFYLHRGEAPIGGQGGALPLYPPLLALAHNRAEEVEQELHGKLLNLKVFNPLLAAALLSPARLLLNISSNVKFNRWLVIMKTNSREIDRLPRPTFAPKMLENFPTFLSLPPLRRKSHERPSNFCNKASSSPVSREFVPLCHSLRGLSDRLNIENLEK